MSVPRILIFSHDGRGLGHLRRLSHLGRALQGPASVLFLTGLRQASWLVPETCEFVHIPSRDSLIAKKSRQWNRDPFVPEDSLQALRMRPDLIRATIKTFQPDALIVDYLVLGMDDELCDVVFNMPSCEKYYILRGVLGRPVDVRTDVLTPMSLEALRNHFRRIIVMCDPKIIDTASEYNLDSTLSDKITYAGYAVGSPTKDQIENARRSRGVPDGKHWAVCSTGSGKAGENLAQRCWEISRLFPEVYFDIITGPRSTLQFNDNIHQSRRVILTPENPTSLPAMHAAADVVITRGGYNSLLEACIGTAQIIVAPIEGDYEQNEHAKRLGAYRDLSIIPSLEDLDLGLEEALSKGPAQPLKPSCISLCGAEAAARLITADLTACPSNDSVLQPTTEYAV